MNTQKTMISEDRQKLVVHLMDRGASLAFTQSRGEGMTMGDLADVFFDGENCLSGRLASDGAVLVMLRSALEDAGFVVEKMKDRGWFIVWHGTQMMGRITPERYVLKLACVDESVAAVLSLAGSSGMTRGQ